MLVTQGIGMLIGAQVAGWIVQTHTVNNVADWKTIWLIPCIAAAVVMVLFFVLFDEAHDQALETEARPELEGTVELGPVT